MFFILNWTFSIRPCLHTCHACMQRLCSDSGELVSDCWPILFHTPPWSLATSEPLATTDHADHCETGFRLGRDGDPWQINNHLSLSLRILAKHRTSGESKPCDSGLTRTQSPPDSPYRRTPIQRNSKEMYGSFVVFIAIYSVSIYFLRVDLGGLWPLGL